MLAIGKGKTEKHMGNGRAHPVGGDQVDALQLAEVEILVVIGRLVVVLAAVGKVADVVHPHPLAADGCVGQHGDIGLPVPLVGRLQGLPPQQQAAERKQIGQQRRPPPAPREQTEQGQQ